MRLATEQLPVLPSQTIQLNKEAEKNSCSFWAASETFEATSRGAHGFRELRAITCTHALELLFNLPSTHGILGHVNTPAEK